MKSKLEILQEDLVNFNLDAFLVTDSINRRYITGFTGTAGAVLITREENVFITDFRYTEQAHNQVNGFTIIEQNGSLEDEISNQLNRLEIQKLGFDKKTTSYGHYQLYSEYFNASLIPVGGIIESLRIIKTPEEIEVLKKAAKIADETFEHILAFIKPGVREIEIANELDFHMRKLGASSPSFDIIVASGYRSAMPHGVASEKKIAAHELVTMDFGAFYQGYCSDLTRTVAVGSISEDLMEIYQTVLNAQQLGVEKIGPGITGKDADAITRDYIESKGFGAYFGHSTGHGIGLDIHEAPTLSKQSTDVLKEGMIVTVEPGIYIPDIGGCRIEDDIIITKNGNERLTSASKELIYL